MDPLWVAKNTSIGASLAILSLVYFAGYFGMGLVWIVILMVLWLFSDARAEKMRQNHHKVLLAQAFHHPDVLNEVINGLPHWVRFPDFERVEWLNKIVHILWPHVKEATERTVREALDPVFEENKPSFLSRLGFDTLTLGDDSPTFTGMKVYEGKNEVMIDIEMRMAMPRSNIVIAAGTSAVAMKVGVRELQVFGVFRVVLARLHGDFPCFKMIATSFAEPPQIDFKLEIMGGNFMAIPGLNGWIQSFLKNTLVETYVWPKVVVTPMSLVSDGDFAWPGDRPPDRMFMTQKQVDKMTTELYKEIDKPAGVFKVKLISAVDLMKKDRLGKSDPFVKFSLGRSKNNQKNSRVIDNDLNPKWDQDFEFTVQNPTREFLQLQLMDHNVGRDNPLGDVRVNLKHFKSYEKQAIDVGLNNVKTGRVQLQAVYVPFEDEEDVGEDEAEQENAGEKPVKEVFERMKTYGRGTLKVDVSRASDLIAADSGGTSDPYCIVTVGNKTFKTKKIKKTLNPVWNESTSFEVFDPELEEIVVEVFDFDRVSSHDTLGKLRISIADVLASKNNLVSEFALEGVESGSLMLSINFSGTKLSTEEAGSKFDFTPVPVSETRTESHSIVPSLPSFKKSRSSKAVAGKLEVVLKKGIDLVAMDKGQTSDPFVKFKVGKNKYKSKVIKTTLNPTWNESFDLPVSDPSTDKLEMAVCDKDRISSDPMGDCELLISEVLDNGGTLEKEFPLRNVKHGSIILSARYVQA